MGGEAALTCVRAAQLVLSAPVLAGQCLALNGTAGHVDIRLREAIVVHGVTLEHLPR